MLNMLKGIPSFYLLDASSTLTLLSVLDLIQKVEKQCDITQCTLVSKTAPGWKPLLEYVE